MVSPSEISLKVNFQEVVFNIIKTKYLNSFHIVKVVSRVVKVKARPALLKHEFETSDFAANC